MLIRLALRLRPRSADRRARSHVDGDQGSPRRRARIQGGFRREERVADQGSHAGKGQRRHSKRERVDPRSSTRSRRIRTIDEACEEMVGGSRGEVLRRAQESRAQTERPQVPARRGGNGAVSRSGSRRQDNRKTETEFGRWIAQRRTRDDERGRRDRQAGILGLNTNLDKRHQAALQADRRHLPLRRPVAVRSARANVVCARHSPWLRQAGHRRLAPSSTA